MKAYKRLKVIRVTVKGDVGYVRSVSMFGEPLSWSPFNAKNYYGDDKLLERDLTSLVLPNDEVFAKSGLRVDTADVVEFEMEVNLTELSARTARKPRVVVGDL